MNSSDEARQTETGGSRQQAVNTLALLRDAIDRKLIHLTGLLEFQPDVRQVTIIVTLDRRKRPRTVILRTESKSELSS